MHEYPITLNIIELAARHASNAVVQAANENDGPTTGRNSRARVKKIALVIGEASGIMGESIRLYFDIIAEGTVCEGAVLEIETVKPMLKCKTCGKLFERKPFSFECECGGEGEPTEIGREFYVKYIEVEQEK